MYPNKDKIHKAGTLMILGFVVFIAAVFSRSFFYTPKGDLGFYRLVYFIGIGVVLLYWLILGIWGTKTIVCPNCKGRSFSFFINVTRYYLLLNDNRKDNIPPPECPHCGRKYGDYTPK